MNIFILDYNPTKAAEFYCDKHIPKMCTELSQQLSSAVIRHGATEDQLPLTKSGTPVKGGYHHHPCTVWCGETSSNFIWACHHAIELCRQFTKRFHNTHFCQKGIEQLFNLCNLIPFGSHTPFALAMPDELRSNDAVESYRNYYRTKPFASWEKGVPQPSWF